ncbi:DEAD/DEAH box helicase [Phlyctema vagabunda]|uniref:RNA helicase n=1 Tax=Phlyctema vagabunda TaxID=108571 RepID=A0ABR4PRT7_9HELO
MSAWETTDMAAALPDPAVDGTVAAANQDGSEPTPARAVRPGWGAQVPYNYALYNQSGRPAAEGAAPTHDTGAEGVNYSIPLAPDQAMVAAGEWASNAQVYEWCDEFGEVGPAFPELENMLFGDENHVQTGINFSAITSIEVFQEGSVQIAPVRKFEDAGLHPVMLQNVKLAGYDLCTPVQAYTLPAILKDHDVVACAQTGSGKTAAYLVPTLSKLMGKAKKLAAPRPNPATYDPSIHGTVRAEPLLLVVAPSRELATQIFNEARRFCYRSMLRPCVVYGGGPIYEQIEQLQKGCDVLICTPGRLCDFIDRTRLLSLHRLKYLIIDEADELLQADWQDEMSKIMNGAEDQEEGNLIYMLFSATFPKEARDLAKEHLAMDHVRIRVGRAGSSHVNIKQEIVYVEPSLKQKALIDLLDASPPARTIIFVNSKRAADELDDFLFNAGLPTTAIHSDRTQREREDSIRAFRVGTCPIIVATGVSARGLDIADVMQVINYDFPSSMYGGIEEYTHRIGRTGRAGNRGIATSFYNDRDDALAEPLVKLLLETKQPIPEFLEQYIPEGFANGAGDIAQLKFETDSDFGEDAAAEGTADAGGWGTETVAEGSADAGGWGAETAPVEAGSKDAGGWGVSTTSTQEPEKVEDGGWSNNAATSGW